MSPPQDPPPPSTHLGPHHSLNRMFEHYYLDYARYVILDRAIPHLDDGLKPVQRRILYSLAEMHDGRYNKVANIIGHCMRYHPHGDTSIGDAMVHMGQKGLLIDTQGNWGHPVTGDQAAAPRYIEARLTPFAMQVIFNTLKQTALTHYQLSYDARFNEPVTLPSKFPLLLFQGAEGIAVGLATKIYPHNFNEIIDACIAALQNQTFELLPDFPTGGLADASQYNDGKRGGKIKLRAKIKPHATTQLIISEIPYETTSQSLIHSILQAEEKGHIHIKKIEDNSTAEVEIVLHLNDEHSQAKVIDALYAFTKCQVSLAANSCVIDGDIPVFIGITEIIQKSAARTQHLLTEELKYEQAQLTETIFALTLEQIFITERIYPAIETGRSMAEIMQILKHKIAPFLARLNRQPTQKDYLALTEIKIRRISLFDSKTLDQKIQQAQTRLDEIQIHLNAMTNYTIDYFKQLRTQYGDQFPRKTQLTAFTEIAKQQVSSSVIKLFIQANHGLVGTAVKPTTNYLNCSVFDLIIAITANGCLQVFTPTNQHFVAPKILYCDVYLKGETQPVFHLIYRKGKLGPYFIKKFQVGAVTRGRMYSLVKNEPDSKIVYLKSVQMSPPESLTPPAKKMLITLGKNKLGPKPRKTTLIVDFSQIPLQAKDTKGKLLTKYRIAKITQFKPPPT